MIAPNTVFCALAGITRYLAVSGGIWRYLAVSGGIWRYLAVSGGIWRYLAVSGGIWRYLAVSGGNWRYLVGITQSPFTTRLILTLYDPPLSRTPPGRRLLRDHFVREGKEIRELKT